MKPALLAAIALAFAIHLAPRCEAEQRSASIAQAAQYKQPSSVPEPVSAESASTNNYSYEAQSPSGDSTSQWVLVIVGIVTVIFIGWQARETRRAALATRDSVGHIERQARIMESQLTEMQSAGAQTAGLIEHAGKQASAAHSAANTAERALRLVQRADILLDKAGAQVYRKRQSPDGSEWWEIDGNSNVILTFKNFGPTRANNVKIEASQDTPGAALIERQQPPLPPVVLGAGAEQIIPFQRFSEAMPKELFQRIAEGKQPLTFKAKVTYDDVFGQAHISEYEGIFERPNSFLVTKQSAT